MALFEDVLEGGIGPGLAIGIGAAVLIPVLRPVLRPAAKAVVKAGLMAYHRGQDAMAYINEMTGDLVAEARSEMEGARAGERAGGPA
jgi:hypothetical protein